MTAPFLDAEAVRRDTIAAYRYLAFIAREYQTLVLELKPDHQPGEVAFHPCDDQVENLMINGSAIERARIVACTAARDVFDHRAKRRVPQDSCTNAVNQG